MTDNRTLVAECITKWADMERARLGDAFATTSELRNIKADPLGNLDLLKFCDAFEVFSRILEWN